MSHRAIVHECRRRLEEQLRREVSDEEYLILLVRIYRNVRCANPTSIDDRIHAFFETYYPELALRMGPTALAKRIAARASFSREELADRWVAKDSIGATLTDAQRSFLASMLPLLDRTLTSPRRCRSELLCMLEERIAREVRLIAPSLAVYLRDDLLCALLIERAGGRARIARRSSNYVQTLGAERSFFNGERPKHGLIHAHASVRDAQRPGRSARKLANAITMHVREDHFRCT